MISLPDRSRVLVPGFSDWGAAGSGICLTHTTTFMADHLCGTGPFPAIRPGDKPLFESPRSWDVTTGRSGGAGARRDQPLVEAVGDHGVHAGRHQRAQVIGGVD